MLENERLHPPGIRLPYHLFPTEPLLPPASDFFLFPCRVEVIVGGRHLAGFLLFLSFFRLSFPPVVQSFLNIVDQSFVPFFFVLLFLSRPNRPDQANRHYGTN